MAVWGTPEAIPYIEQALEIDPDNTDALSMCAQLAQTQEEARELLQRAITTAEFRLGPNFEKTYKGAFWVVIETRPYLRALALLAQLESTVENRKEAIRIMERILKLNPNDNQGIRYMLIGLVLAEKQMVKCRKLLEAYADDQAAWITWGKVLYFFVQKDRASATKYLKKARKLNPYVELYLSGNKPFPEELPEEYCLGDENEAILAASDLAEAWSRRQNALFWLSAQLIGDSAYIRHVARMIDGR